MILSESQGSNEKRREPRIPAAYQASMEMVYLSEFDRMAVTVVDVSRGGLKLCGPVFVPPGTAFRIQMERLIVKAEVRHCLPVGAEFHIGAAIQDMYFDARAVA